MSEREKNYIPCAGCRTPVWDMVAVLTRRGSYCQPCYKNYGFNGVTPEQARTMPKSEIHNRLFEEYGFWGGMGFVMKCQIPNVILLLVIGAVVGIYELFS